MNYTTMNSGCAINQNYHLMERTKHQWEVSKGFNDEEVDLEEEARSKLADIDEVLGATIMSFCNFNNYVVR